MPESVGNQFPAVARRKFGNHNRTLLREGYGAARKTEIGSLRTAITIQPLIRKAGGTASFQRTDVLVAAEIEALVDHAVKTYGGLDLAFNNAGIEGDVAPLAEQTEANYDAVMDVNVKGVWLSMKYEIPKMLERGGGAIVNCSSVGGLIGFPSM